MLFNVSQLLREETGASRNYDLEPEGNVHSGHVELIRTPGGVLVRCRAEVGLEAECSRCLTPFGYMAQVEFEEVYAQQVDPVTGRRLEIEDPDAFLIGADHSIDITEAVRQYSDMAAEMQPLCRPDCPGICPVCGTDMSIAPCQCDRTPIDPRWQALVALKRKTNG
ncbi:MAG: DUF177 domain-containing protein [Dehalococcoidia bacterium]